MKDTDLRIYAALSDRVLLHCSGKFERTLHPCKSEGCILDVQLKHSVERCQCVVLYLGDPVETRITNGKQDEIQKQEKH